MKVRSNIKTAAMTKQNCKEKKNENNKQSVKKLKIMQIFWIICFGTIHFGNLLWQHRPGNYQKHYQRTKGHLSEE